MGRLADRYCPDCGSRLQYDRVLSTPNVPNEFRKMVYWCMKCFNQTGKKKVIAIEKHIVIDAVDSVSVYVAQDEKPE